MSELKIRDFYGQYLRINNETRSGNVVLVAKTVSDLNKACLTKEEDMDIEVSLSFERQEVILLIVALEHMIRDE